MAWCELWGEPYWDYSWTVTLAKRGASPSPVGWLAPWGGYVATYFAAPPVRTHGMGRAARHPLCTWGLGVEGDCGVVWVPFALYWRLLMLEGLGTTSACAEVSSIPGACPGSGMCLVAQDWKHPGQSLRMGELGRPQLGPCLGPCLGPHVGQCLLGTTLVIPFSIGSAGSFPLRLQGARNHPVPLHSRSELLRADGCWERV